MAPEINFYLRQNIIATKDDLVYLGQYTYIGYFYDVGKFINRPRFKTGSNVDIPQGR